MYIIKEYLLVAGEILFVAALLIIVGRWLNTKNPKEHFWLAVAMYVLYIIFMCAIFTGLPSMAVQLLERGAIEGMTVHEATSFLYILFFALINSLILIIVVAYHCSPKRKEMSEMDRLKLNDL